MSTTIYTLKCNVTFRDTTSCYLKCVSIIHKMHWVPHSAALTKCFNTGGLDTFQCFFGNIIFITTQHLCFVTRKSLMTIIARIKRNLNSWKKNIIKLDNHGVSNVFETKLKLVCLYHLLYKYIWHFNNKMW